MTTQIPINNGDEFHVVAKKIFNLLGGEERLSGNVDSTQGLQTLRKRLYHLSKRFEETLDEATDIVTAKENYKEFHESTAVLMAFYESIRIISNSLSSESLDYPNMGHSDLLTLDEKMFLIKFFAHEIQLKFLPANDMYMKLLDRDRRHVEFLNKCLGDSA